MILKYCRKTFYGSNNSASAEKSDGTPESVVKSPEEATLTKASADDCEVEKRGIDSSIHTGSVSRIEELTKDKNISDNNEDESVCFGELYDKSLEDGAEECDFLMDSESQCDLDPSKFKLPSPCFGGVGDNLGSFEAMISVDPEKFNNTEGDDLPPYTIPTDSKTPQDDIPSSPPEAPPFFSCLEALFDSCDKICASETVTQQMDPIPSKCSIPDKNSDRDENNFEPGKEDGFHVIEDDIGSYPNGMEKTEDISANKKDFLMNELILVNENSPRDDETDIKDYVSSVAVLKRLESLSVEESEGHDRVVSNLDSETLQSCLDCTFSHEEGQMIAESQKPLDNLESNSPITKLSLSPTSKETVITQNLASADNANSHECEEAVKASPMKLLDERYIAVEGHICNSIQDSDEHVSALIVDKASTYAVTDSTKLDELLYENGPEGLPGTFRSKIPSYLPSSSNLGKFDEPEKASTENEMELPYVSPSTSENRAELKCANKANSVEEYHDLSGKEFVPTHSVSENNTCDSFKIEDMRSINRHHLFDPSSLDDICMETVSERAADDVFVGPHRFATGAKNRRHEELDREFEDSFYGFKNKEMYHSVKRVKHSTDRPDELLLSTDEEGKNEPKWMTLQDMISKDAVNLVYDTLRSIKILIGSKLCDAYCCSPGVDGANSDDSLIYPCGSTYINSFHASSSFGEASLSHLVYSDTKMLISYAIETLKKLNSLRKELNCDFVEAIGGNVALEKNREAYCSLVRKNRALSRSIRGYNNLMLLQKNLILVKTEKLRRMSKRILRLKNKHHILKVVTPKIENLNTLVSTLSNLYDATGIRILPISAPKMRMNTLFAVSFTTYPNSVCCWRKKTSDWTEDLIYLSERALGEIVPGKLGYHKMDLDQKYKVEVHMLVYIKNCDLHSTEDRIRPLCIESVPRYREGPSQSDAAEVTKTPRESFKQCFSYNDYDRATSSMRYSAKYVSSLENPACSRSDVHSICISLRNPRAESVRTDSSAVEFEPNFLNVRWDDEPDLEQLKRNIRVVFSSQGHTYKDESFQVWEQCKSRMIHATSVATNRFVSKFISNRSSNCENALTIFELMRELISFASSAISSVRSLQRELCQWIQMTSSCSLVIEDNRMQLRSMLVPKDALKPCLWCNISVDVDKLMQYASYVKACRSITVEETQIMNDEKIAKAINQRLEVEIRNNKALSLSALVCSACAKCGYEVLQTVTIV